MAISKLEAKEFLKLLERMERVLKIFGERLDRQQAACRERLDSLPCCQRRSRRQRQQCGLAAANPAAAL